MDQKLAFMGAPLLTDSDVPSGAIAFLPPRRMTPAPGFRELSRNERGLTFALEYLVEPMADWLNRGTVMYNVGVK